MRIISSFKDYYDFAYVNNEKGDYRETVYLRKTGLAITDAPISPFYNYYCCSRDDCYIRSRWWENNKKIFRLPENLLYVRSGCFFVCGKAFPFLFLRDKAVIGTKGKCGQIKLSAYFNKAIEDSIIKSKKILRRDQVSYDEEYFNFFKTYYSINELIDDVSIDSCIDTHWYKPKDYLLKHLKEFFDFYEGKDFTALHMSLDCPILLTMFEHKECSIGISKKEYEFMLDPNLYEFDFMRVIPGEIMLQELEMFIGNILVKDVMPQSFQSDIDKLTSHGFDAKTSFRKVKDKKYNNCRL